METIGHQAGPNGKQGPERELPQGIPGWEQHPEIGQGQKREEGQDKTANERQEARGPGALGFLPAFCFFGGLGRQEKDS
jgi:hypothetical protein